MRKLLVVSLSVLLVACSSAGSDSSREANTTSSEEGGATDISRSSENAPGSNIGPSAALINAVEEALGANTATDLELTRCPAALMTPVEQISPAIGMPLIFSRGSASTDPSASVACIFHQGDDSDGRDWQLDVRVADQAEPESVAQQAGWLDESAGWVAGAGGTYVAKTIYIADQEPEEGGCAMFWYAETLTVILVLTEPSEATCAELEPVLLASIPDVVEGLSTLTIEAST